MKIPSAPSIERVLFSEEEIRDRIRQVAAEISEHYRDGNLKLIGVLKGSIFFLTALARELAIPVKVDMLAISSFSNHSGAETPSGTMPGETELAPAMSDRRGSFDASSSSRPCASVVNVFG